MNNRNYMDKQGNYHNIENLSLGDIYRRGYVDGYNQAKMEDLKKDLGITIKTITGEWEYEKGEVNSVFRCTNCGHFPSKDVFVEEDDERYNDMAREDAYRFCPHCGAQMKRRKPNG